MIEIGQPYKTNKGYSVTVLKEVREGYFLTKKQDEEKYLIVDRKGVSVVYVDLFLML